MEKFIEIFIETFWSKIAQFVTVFVFVFLYIFSSADTQTQGWPSCDQLKNGDIIFQKSRSFQSQAIKEVTGSLWSHVGVIFKYDGVHPEKFYQRVKTKVAKEIIAKKGCYVLEAIQPVSASSLKDFIFRSEIVNKKRYFAIKRFKGGEVSGLKLYDQYRKFKGRNYDILFQTSFKKLRIKNPLKITSEEKQKMTLENMNLKNDKNNYCSELVWILFADQNIQLGDWTTVGQLLSGIHVSKKNTPILIKLEEQRLKSKGLTLKSLSKNLTITPVSIYNDPQLKCIYGCK